MTTISSTNIESAAYSSIFTVLDNRSNIVDPKRKSMTNITTQKRKFIYDYDPFSIAINFDEMPYIILDLPIVEYSAMSANGKVKDITWKQTIVVRTVREGASNVDTDRGRTDMLDICDDLQETFNKKSVRQGLLSNNVRMVNLQKMDSSFDIINNREIYEATFELTYFTRMVVSA